MLVTKSIALTKKYLNVEFCHILCTMSEQKTQVNFSGKLKTNSSHSHFTENFSSGKQQRVISESLLHYDKFHQLNGRINWYLFI